MRLLLSLLGAASLALVGWIGWRATAETREWRELQALGANPKRSEAEGARFKQLARRFVPEEGPDYRPWQVRRLQDARILVFFVPMGRKGPLHLSVFDESRNRLSTSTLDVGIHPCGLEYRPDASGFIIGSCTPGPVYLRRFVLTGDCPALVSSNAPD